MITAPNELRAEYLTDPVGLPLEIPRLSWCSGDARPAEMQTAWQVQAASSQATLVALPDLWDSGIVEGSDNLAVLYGGRGVSAQTCVYWRVRTFDSDGLASEWSETAHFEFALAEQGFRADWIAVPLHGTRTVGTPVPLLRRRFRVAETGSRARLYIAVLGACRIWINETELDVSEVPSGYTNYRKRIQYRSLCVDGLVKSGANSLTVLLADGWHTGFADGDTREHFGARPQLLARLTIDSKDGPPVEITSDSHWEWRVSPLIRGDINAGASIDGRAFGNHPDYLRQKRQWLPIEILAPTEASLVAWAHDGVRPLTQRIVGSMQRKSPLRPGERRWWITFPEAVLGRVHVSLQGQSGTHIRLRYAASTDATGALVFATDDQDDYTLRGDGQSEAFVPPFVRHHFRMVELCGDLAADGVLKVEAVPVQQALQKKVELHAEHPLLERFHALCLKRNLGLLQEVAWSGFAAGNRFGDYLSLYPVIDTLAMQFDLSVWLRGWLDEMLAEECVPAGLPETVPPLRHARRLVAGIGSAEALDSPTSGDPQRLSEMALYIAQTLYLHYGDRQALVRVFPYVRRLLFTLEALHPNLIRPVDGTTWQCSNMDADVIGTALFSSAARIAIRVADWLDLDGEASSFRDLAARIRIAFRQRYVTQGGLLVTDSANAYALALSESLLDGDEVPSAFNRFAQMVLDAGFQSMVHPLLVDNMLNVLTMHGRPDLAYALMLQTAAPAWLAPLIESSNSHESQISLANAAPIGWLYRHVAGLRPVPHESEAFRRVIIQPCVPFGELFPEGAPLNAVEFEFHSMHGRYLIRWSLLDGVFTLHVEIPCGCEARIVLPDGTTHDVVAGRHDFRLLTDDADPIPMLSETY